MGSFSVASVNRNVVASADVFQYYSYFVAALTVPNHQDDEITMTIEAICKRETEHEDTTIIRGITMLILAVIAIAISTKTPGIMPSRSDRYAQGIRTKKSF